MIELRKDFPDNVVAVTCKGRITREDYEAVLIPEVEAKLAAHPKLRLYYEIGPDFEGIDPGAVWADFKVGMEHLTRWERMAVVTDVDWIKYTLRFFGFLVPGEFRFYAPADADEARRWITAS